MQRAGRTLHNIKFLDLKLQLLINEGAEFQPPYFYLTSSNSTSKTSVALGGITPPAPAAP